MIKKLKVFGILLLAFSLAYSIRSAYNAHVLAKEVNAKNALLEKEKDQWKAQAAQAEKDHQKEIAAIKKKYSKPATVQTVNETKPEGLGDVAVEGGEVVIKGDPQGNLDA